MADALEQRIATAQPLGQAVCEAMRAELQRQGFDDALQRVAAFDLAEFSLHKDPFDGRESLKGVWDGRHGGYGHILLYPDGMVYAEVDVIHAHPKKKKWFVEAVTAWGHEDNLKTELRLLPALE